jgi:hypothetical protein
VRGEEKKTYIICECGGPSRERHNYAWLIFAVSAWEFDAWGCCGSGSADFEIEAMRVELRTVYFPISM